MDSAKYRKNSLGKKIGTRNIEDPKQEIQFLGNKRTSPNINSNDIFEYTTGKKSLTFL